MRKLGIPTVLDRYIQQAVMQVLQRQWDPTFSDHSYGFRPGRSAHQAVAQAQQYIAGGPVPYNCFPMLWNPLICSLDAVVKLHYRVVRPELIPDFLARNHIAALLNQHAQHLEGLFLQKDLASSFAEFSCSEVKLEHTKTHPFWETDWHKRLTEGRLLSKWGRV
jgi:hypothetical protein